MHGHRAELRIGYRVFFDHLEKGELLGKGGFGVVCAARYFGMRVAVKEQKPREKKMTAAEQNEVEREFLMHFHLRHDRVVEVLAFNADPERGYVLRRYDDDDDGAQKSSCGASRSRHSLRSLSVIPICTLEICTGPYAW